MPRRHRSKNKMAAPHKPRTVPKIGDPEVRARWNPKKSVKQNFAALGLKVSPNEPDRPAPPNPIEFKLDPPAPPRRERLNLQEVGYYKALVKKYGDDYSAMARDMKLNPWQKTPAQLRKKCLLYLEKYHKD